MYNDSVYAARISALTGTIPLKFNNHVRDFIDFYTTQRRPMMAMVIGRSYDYFPFLEATLKRNNMPPELVNLAVIESALRTQLFLKGKRRTFGRSCTNCQKRPKDMSRGFIAMCYLTSNYSAHNLKAIDPSLLNRETVPVTVNAETALVDLSRSLSITPEEVVYFNPQFAKVMVIPANSTILLPSHLAKKTV